MYTRGKIISVKLLSLDSLEYYRHFVPASGSIVFDVGGELGVETEQLAKMVGTEGEVYCFECFPAHINGLKKLVDKYQQIKLIEKACWNCKDKLTFFVGSTPGSNTAVPEATGQRGQSLADFAQGSISVEAETLDYFWKTNAGGRPVDFLKMDIEGAEYEALEGAKELLKQTNKIIVAAYHIREGIRTAPKVSQMLEEVGFHVRTDENFHVYGVRKISR